MFRVMIKMRYIRIFLAFVLLSAMAAGSQDSPSAEAVALAMDYLLSCQKEDGGFGSNSESLSNIKDTSLAVTALAVAGKNLSALAMNGTDPIQYLVLNDGENGNLSNVEAQTGRYVIALVSAGLDARDINGKDYVQILKSYFHPGGEVGKENYIWDDAFVIMALAACNESQSNEVKGALDHLSSLQTAKGGWAWNEGANGEDPDTTSIILCAIIDGGEETSSEVVRKGLQYLSSEQNDDGGFSSLGSNAATDSWAILAIQAAGQNPEEWKVGSADPVRHLLGLQKEDGSVWWKSNSEGMSFEWTANMILALTGGRMPPVIFGGHRNGR
jgi:squalene cyclase